MRSKRCAVQNQGITLTNVMELDCPWKKKIVATTHVDRSSPTVTLLY